MQISVVVPVLNERSALPAAIRRLAGLKAADPELEVLIVDGGSDDGTADLLRALDVDWITADRGRAAQMNAGAAATRGEVVLFLHADTALPKGGLAAVRRAVEDGAAGGFFRVRLASNRRLLRLVGALVTARSRVTGIATGDQAIFVARRAFEQLGGFPPLPLFEDVELSRRLRALGRTARLPLTVETSARRWEGHGPWRTIVQMWILRVLYYVGFSPGRLARYYEAVR